MNIAVVYIILKLLWINIPKIHLFLIVKNDNVALFDFLLLLQC